MTQGKHWESCPLSSEIQIPTNFCLYDPASPSWSSEFFHTWKGQNWKAIFSKTPFPQHVCSALGECQTAQGAIWKKGLW